jgi:hypothetical protein
MVWPFRQKKIGSCFPIGRYSLNVPVPPPNELREFSAEEYAV